MKVLILMPLAKQRGGAEQLLLALMQHGRTANVTWTVVFFEDGPMRDAVAAQGAETAVLEVGRLREFSQYMRSVAKLTQLLKKKEIDLVFSWMSKAHLYGGVAAWRAGVPALWYQHGTPTTATWMDWLITLVPAEKVLACSRAAASAQKRLRPRRPVCIAHPCVDISRFNSEALPTSAEARRQLGLPVEGALIGIVGRLQRWKGMHVLVEAMPQILAQHPDTHVVIVGGQHDMEPDYEECLDGQIKALGLEERVIRAGFQKNVPHWMQAMDVVVHASDNEPFGIVIIEAMALGKPVVAGDQGGPREIITEGTDGLLAPYGNADVLAGQILRFLNDPALRRSAGEAARKRAQDFAPRRYAQNFIRAIGALT